VLAQSFDLNAMDPDFKWPQSWTTDLAIDQQLPVGDAGNARAPVREGLEQRLHAERRSVAPTRTLPEGGRITGSRRQRAQLRRGGRIYVIDNTERGLLVQHHGDNSARR
jgi:hypothetical protein